jgi:hypothetical protein
VTLNLDNPGNAWPWNGWRGKAERTGQPWQYELLSNVRPAIDGRCKRCWQASACELDDRCNPCGGSFMQYKRGVALPPFPGDWP